MEVENSIGINWSLIPILMMQKVKLRFSNITNMVYFILAFRLSDFIPDWRNASLTAELEMNAINTACTEYGAATEI